MSKNDVWLNRNGGQLSELDGTEWLYPPGAPSTERCFTEMKTGFLILTGSNRIVRKIKDFFDLCWLIIVCIYSDISSS